MIAATRAVLWTLVAGLTEAGGGLLFALGLLSPLGSLGVIAPILIALVLMHWRCLWVIENGMEYDLILIAAALAVALVGPGAYSLENFRHVFDGEIQGIFVDRMEQNHELFNKLMTDPSLKDVVTQRLRQDVYERILEESARPPGGGMADAPGFSA